MGAFFVTQGDQNIKDLLDANNGQEQAFLKAVKKKAEEEVRNPGITVDVTKKDFYLPKKETVEGTEKDVAGKVSFIIKLTDTENGRVRSVKADYDIPETEIGAYVSMTEMTAEVGKIFTSDSADAEKENDGLKAIAAKATPDNDEEALKTAIETELKKIVAEEPAEDEPATAGETTPAAPVVKKGYTFKLDKWEFSAATQDNNAKVSFDVIIKSAGGSVEPAKVSVKCDDLIKAADKYQTVGELVELITAAGDPWRITVDNLSEITDVDTAVNAINTHLAAVDKDLLAEGASLTATAAKTTEPEAEKSEYKTAEGNEPAYVTNIVITVDIKNTAKEAEGDEPETTAKTVKKAKVQFVVEKATD